MTSVGIMASSVFAGPGDVLMEPFNDFTTNGWVLSGSPTPSIVTGRTGTAAQTSGASARADYNIPAAQQDAIITVGFAFRYTDGQSITRELLRFSSDAGATNHNRLFMLSNGTFNFTRNVSNIAASASGMLVNNTWYYLELQATLHDTAGAVIVRRNGVNVINATSLDTKNAGTKTVYDQFTVAGLATGSIHQYDDLYLTTGVAAFKGDITIP